MSAFSSELALTASCTSLLKRPESVRSCKQWHTKPFAHAGYPWASHYRKPSFCHWNESTPSSSKSAHLSSLEISSVIAVSLPTLEGLAVHDKLRYTTRRGKTKNIRGDTQLCRWRLNCSSKLGLVKSLEGEGGFHGLPSRCRDRVALHREGRGGYMYLGPFTGRPYPEGRGPRPPRLAWWNDFFQKPEPPEDFPTLRTNPDGSDEIDEMIEDDVKFRAWQRKRQVLEDIRDAQETGRLPDDRGWEDWLDDSWSNEYKQKYVQGDRSGWYEEQTEWEKDGKPRSPPPIPERGMNRTIKELSLLAFFNQEEVEEDITFEERIFRYTSQQTAKIVVVLILVPWFTGFMAHEYLFVPFLDRYVQEVPLAAKLLDCREKQKLEMIETLRLERQRVKFEAEIGKTPPLSDEELAEHMHEEAVHLREEVRSENRKAFANIWSDAIALLVFVLLLVSNPRQVEILRITGDRIFTNVSDMGKAFLIILFTDIFLGYHSESGWETLVEIVLEHYGLEASQASIYIFIAIVPVSIDAFFKLWVFRALRKLSPSAAATFSQMKRH